MLSSYTSATATTPAHLHTIASHLGSGHLGNVGHVRKTLSLVFEYASTFGTAGRLHRNVSDRCCQFIDRGRLPVAEVPHAGLSTRTTGLRGPLALGEWSCLALARSLRCGELLAKLLDRRRQTRVPVLQPVHPSDQAVVFTGWRVFVRAHSRSIRTCPSHRNASADSANQLRDRSGPFTRSANEQDVINKLNSLTSNEFYLGVHMEGELSRTLGKNYVTRPFNELLKSHTREEVQRMIEEGGMYAAPSRKVEYGDWTLEGWLSPVSSESKRRNAYHEIVIEPFRASRTDSASSVKNALLVKGDRYGELDGPMVVAVNPRDEFYSYHNSDMDVLFGTEQLVYLTQSSDSQPQLVRKSDGVWPRRNSLDAVMRFMKVDLWNITRATTCLYVNPYKSDIELPRELFRLPHAEGQDGVISWADGEEITRLLGLPSG